MEEVEHVERTLPFKLQFWRERFDKIAPSYEEMVKIEASAQEFVNLHRQWNRINKSLHDNKEAIEPFKDQLPMEFVEETGTVLKEYSQAAIEYLDTCLAEKTSKLVEVICADKEDYKRLKWAESAKTFDELKNLAKDTIMKFEASAMKEALSILHMVPCFFQNILKQTTSIISLVGGET